MTVCLHKSDSPRQSIDTQAAQCIEVPLASTERNEETVLNFEYD